VGLLVVVAVASYRESQAQKYRYEALKTMTELSQGLHQHFAQARTFQGAKLAYSQSPRDGAARYRITLAAAPVKSRDPDLMFQASSDLGFTLQATPTHDDACGVLLLDQSGRRGVSAGTVADCWR
jgi:type IV pilus assembly protein PilE